MKKRRLVCIMVLLSISVAALLRANVLPPVLVGAAAWASELERCGLFTPLVSLVLGAASMLVSAFIAVYGNRQTQKRELERDKRDSFLMFYEPLLSLLEPLSGYLESAEASAVDLASYDPEVSEHRKKLANVAAYADGLEALFQTGKSALSAQNPELSQCLSLLRLWVLSVSHLAKSEERLAGPIPSDRKALDAMRTIRRVVEDEKSRLKWS